LPHPWAKIVAVRILVLTNMFPPDAYGGYERWCQQVVGHWRRAGHQVLVLTSNVRLSGPDGSETPDAEVRRVLHLYWADHVILRPPLWRRIRWERDNQRRLEEAVRNFRPQVASAWAMGAMSLGLLTRLGDLGLPVVSVVCDEWPVYGPHVDAWSDLVERRTWLGRMLGMSTGLPSRLPDLDVLGPACFVSSAVRRAARERSPWTFPRSTVVPSGIDGGEFPLAPDAGRRPWVWRLLHVGRLDPRKGVHTVIEALAACPAEATLQVLGTGDERYLAELQALSRRVGVADRVHFSACAPSEVAAQYAAADALVFAPLWEEPFGLVPLEAMACGTPVVASPTGGSAEFLVDGDNCVTFPSGDAAALADALRRLAGAPALRQALVEGGVRTAARYDAAKWADELERWHRDAAMEPSATR